jgi:hypothetical protein
MIVTGFSPAALSTLSSRASAIEANKGIKKTKKNFMNDPPEKSTVI